ncbi:hypothetical protein [Stutzerimonas stutzeri]|nr:hypothetical protein [Stutzerimonas stutzeri]
MRHQAVQAWLSLLVATMIISRPARPGSGLIGFHQVIVHGHKRP